MDRISDPWRARVWYHRHVGHPEHPRTRGGAPRGVTVIEVLCVVSILAVLVGLLFPVFSRAREYARKVGCLSSLNQLSMALRLYIQDYDETCPRNRFNDPSYDYPAHYTWKSAIMGYCKTRDVFRCPSNSHYNAPTEAHEPVWRSYALNAAVAEVGPGDAAITEPSATIMLCEARYPYPDVYPSERAWSSFRFSTEWTATPLSALGVIQTHDGRSNFAFFDGHCQSMRPTATLGKHLPLTMWHYSLYEPRNYGNQFVFEAMRTRWLSQLRAHREYRD